MNLAVRTIRSLAVCASALAIIASSPAEAATLLSVDFGSGLPAGWSTQGSAGVSNIFTANQALMLDAGNVADSSVTTGPIQVVANAIYTLSWDGAGICSQDSNGPEGCVRNLWVHVNDQQPGSEPYFGLVSAIYNLGQTPTFTNQTFQFIAPSTSIVLTFLDGTPYPYNLQGLSLVKDITLTGPSPVPEPAVWTSILIGVGIAGAGLRLARRKEAAAPIRT